MSSDENGIKNPSEKNNCHTCSVNPKNWRTCTRTWFGWLKDWILGLKETNETLWLTSRLILILLLSVALLLIAKGICGFLFWNDSMALYNSTLFVEGNADVANTKATLLGVSANVILTCSLIVVTAFYAVDTHAMLKQSRDKQRIEHIIKCLESFYMPVQDILVDQQYVFNKFIPQEYHRNFKNNYQKYLDYFIPPHPYTKNSQQAILYHVQSLELKKISLHRYCAEKLTSDAYLTVISMKNYNDNLRTYENNLDELLKLVKADFDELLRLVNGDIKVYQEELDQLTAKSR